MSRQVNVFGTADVQVSFNKGSTWQDLGTTRDGVAMTSDGYFVEIKNDEYGGEAGPPVEIQYLGETAKIRCELTKFDPVVAELLEDHCQTSTPGGPSAAGTLMFAATSNAGTLNVGAGGSVQVKIVTAANAAIPYRTYTICVVHDAVEVNRGTKFSTFVLTFTAHKDPSTGLLWQE
ncbi:MAG: hypothetical protein ACLP9L_04830 [Thermoguttaceae bacterium]